MNRRAFIGGLLLGAAIRCAHAQQPAKVYRVAVVSPSTPVGEISETGDFRYRAFLVRLRELGYVEGQNLTVARYSAEERTENFAELARTVLRDGPEVISASGDRLAREFRAATDTIPIVTTVSDPVTLGLVKTLARPGGNITGTSIDGGVEMEGKRLELLCEMVPRASKVGYLATRRVWEEGTYVRATKEAAARMKISLVGPPLDAPFREVEYRRVLTMMAREGADALVVNAQPENTTNARLIVELAKQTRLPAIYSYPSFAEIGGLMTYGVDLSDVMRHSADQVDLILKGATPGDIPFYQPTKFHLVINLKTAKALGIEIPNSLLAQADEVIE
ncbi:MAG TPA: ABC transporter substrate-binding protein [Stellaceae bacterium]|nr:ABC transporter substrate-binding protein [Stellaceae bacterium]